MAFTDLIMPKLGESIMEATILKWLKQPGEAVQQDEALLEIATDKVDSEVPATVSGILFEVLYKENDVVPVGAVIAKLKTDTEATALINSETAPAKLLETEMNIDIDEIPYQPVSIKISENDVQKNTGVIRFYSPLVLKIAQEEGISMADLEKISGTGQDGRVSKKDILAYLAGGQKSYVDTNKPDTLAQVQLNNLKAQDIGDLTRLTNFSPTNIIPAATEKFATSYYQPSSGSTEIVELDRMRRLIAKHMIDSQAISAHVTSFAEADVTNLVLWRDKVKKDYEKRESDKLTFTPLFIETVVKCLKKYPWLNSSVDGDNLIVKKDINIGMATALPDGNLIVPVIHHADQLNLVGLSKKVNGLANAARSGKLRPDDTREGTFTITNIGTFGSIMGTPIINQPQVAILAIGAIKKRPVVIETSQGDSIAIRHIMYISLSYDHRIIDGALGSTFLNAIANDLENFNPDRAF